MTFIARVYSLCLYFMCIISQVLEYNVPGGIYILTYSIFIVEVAFCFCVVGFSGKCNRGLMVIGSLRHLAQDRVLTEDEEKKALILGWCIEWVCNQ